MIIYTVLTCFNLTVLIDFDRSILLVFCYEIYILYAIN